MIEDCTLDRIKVTVERGEIKCKEVKWSDGKEMGSLGEFPEDWEESGGGKAK